VLKSKIDAPALKSHVPNSNNQRLKLGGKGEREWVSHSLWKVGRAENECAKFEQRLEMKCLIYSSSDEPPEVLVEATV
jgi:hypothetical protein